MRQSPVILSKGYAYVVSSIDFVTTECGMQNVKVIRAKVLKLLYCAGRLSALG